MFNNYYINNLYNCLKLYRETRCKERVIKDNNKYLLIIDLELRLHSKI